MKRVVHDQFAEAHQGYQLDMILQWGPDSIKLRVYRDTSYPEQSHFESWVWSHVEKKWNLVVTLQPKETVQRIEWGRLGTEDSELAFRYVAAQLLVPTLQVLRKIADIDEKGHTIDHFQVCLDLVCAGVAE